MFFIYILALDMRFINTFLMWESTLKLIKTVEDSIYKNQYTEKCLNVLKIL